MGIDERVHVTDYPRYRYGKWEHVCDHTRAYPKA